MSGEPGKDGSGVTSGSGSGGLKRGKHKKHTCNLGLGSESMLPKATGWFNPCRALKKATLIALNHPESVSNFISHTSIIAERQRQIIRGDAGVIHPYSVLSFMWCAFMVVLYLFNMNLIPFRFAYILENKQPHPIDTMVQVSNALGLLDIVVKFNTGFPDGPPYNIVLSRKRIAVHYICTWFLVDLISSMPLLFLSMHYQASTRVSMFAEIMKHVRLLRIITVIDDLKMITKTFITSYVWRRCIRHTALFGTTMHCLSCAIYFPALINYYWTDKFNASYCKFLGVSDNFLTHYSVGYRYRKSMFIVFSSFFGSGYSRFTAKNWDEVLVNAIIIFISSIMMIYSLVFMAKIYITKYNSTMRYAELMNQVEKYMRHKQFPKQLKKRVRDFYDYRFQERYFKEESALECLSEQLRNEIKLHTCHKLIEKVSLFEGLPASVVGTVLGCLKPEVFMPNDLILRAGDIGGCMYFISTGTVAIYSMKGAEVCHLGDGCHFGEVALLMKDRKRVATVLAVEITQVYRIDAADFRDFIIVYHELYERIETLASKRMHETVLIDEEYRKETRKKSATMPMPEHSTTRLHMDRSASMLHRTHSPGGEQRNSTPDT